MSTESAGPEIKTRLELAELLEQRMARTTASLHEDQRYEKEGNLLKTYVVEAHTQHEGSPLDTLSGEVLAVFGRRDVVEFVPSEEEPDLARADFTTASHQARFYFDVADPRYWLVHTLSPSDSADRYLGQLVQRSRRLDHLWLTTSLIETLGGEDEVTGFGVEFEGASSTGYSAGADLRIQFLSSESRRLVDLLRSDTAFAPSTSLSKVRIRHSVERQGDRYCNDEFRFNGKITARGNSFASHMDLTQRLIGRYGSMVSELESHSAIGYAAEGDFLTVRGAPLTVSLGSRIPDLAAFCEAAFNGAPPFRLLGVPVEINEHAYRVRCVDLHIGEPITFEVLGDRIRVYFQSGTCGNTVMRFLTNVQRSLDARARATVTATGEIL